MLAAVVWIVDGPGGERVSLASASQAVFAASSSAKKASLDRHNRMTSPGRWMLQPPQRKDSKSEKEEEDEKDVEENATASSSLKHTACHGVALMRHVDLPVA